MADASVLLQRMLMAYALLVLGFTAVYSLYTLTLGDDFACLRDELMDTLTHAGFTAVLVTNGSPPVEPRSMFGRAIVALHMTMTNALVMSFFAQAFAVMSAAS